MCVKRVQADPLNDSPAPMVVIVDMMAGILHSQPTGSACVDVAM